MKGNSYSLCKTAVFLNPKDNVIFVSPIRIPVKAKLRFSTNKHFSNLRTMEKIPCAANIPLAIPLNERDLNGAHNHYHSEKQIARWFIKKSEYNKALSMVLFTSVY